MSQAENFATEQPSFFKTTQSRVFRKYGNAIQSVSDKKTDREGIKRLHLMTPDRDFWKEMKERWDQENKQKSLWK